MDNKEKLSSIGLDLLGMVTDLTGLASIDDLPTGAVNIRADGGLSMRRTTKDVDIVTKKDNPGIDIFIKAGSVGETVYIPVVITKTDYKETVYNDFYIGEAADVTIIAGCGIHNSGCSESRHDGIHTFHVGKNARVKYLEKHYGEGDGNGTNVMNPTTVVEIEKNGYMEMDTVQIKGVDSTERVTKATLSEGATLIVGEKIMTHGKQYARTSFEVNLNGTDSSTNVISRSVAKGDSKQIFLANINGNARCNGHSECDAIIMDNAKISAIPEINANNLDASLIHEAAIGRIAGEQLDKLMTLGLSEEEAEQQIINGFLR